MVVTPGCLMAGWWQIHVALSGNALSYLYSVEWPVFAVFAVVGWWHLIHDDPETVGARGLQRARGASEPSAPVDVPVVRRRQDEDEELAAYNDYLAALAASDRQKTWRHP